MRGRAAVLALLMLCMPLSGCLSDNAGLEPGKTDDRLRLEDRHLVEWNWSGSYSRVLEDGPYTALPVQEALIEVDTSDIWRPGRPPPRCTFPTGFLPTPKPAIKCPSSP